MTLGEIYRLAQDDALPCHPAAKVFPPSDRGPCMDWNTAVKGSVHLAQWAKEQEPPLTEIVDRERADIEFLIGALAGARWRVAEAHAANDRRPVPDLPKTSRRSTRGKSARSRAASGGRSAEAEREFAYED